MKHPFNPQPIDQLKARFKAAILVPYNVALVNKDYGSRPSNKPEHIFDFEEGIRMIVSRDYTKELEAIHFSASLTPFHRQPQTKKELKELLERIKLLFKRISGIEEEPEFITMTKQGVPHWVVRIKHLN